MEQVLEDEHLLGEIFDFLISPPTRQTNHLHSDVLPLSIPLADCGPVMPEATDNGTTSVLQLAREARHLCLVCRQWQCDTLLLRERTQKRDPNLTSSRTHSGSIETKTFIADSQ